MIASLPMYDGNPPRLQEFWQAITAHLGTTDFGPVPPILAWPHDFHAHWLAPDLLLSQTCGYPLVTELAGKVQVVGAFHYDAPGCAGVLNRSQLVVRQAEPATTLAELRGRRVAYNSTNSQSGYNSLRALVAPLAHCGGFFGPALATGAHHRSVMAVRDGAADIAAIDCVSLAGFQKHRPDITAGIRVLGETAAYPGLPLITCAGTSPGRLQALRAALAWAAHAPILATVRAELFIRDFEPLEMADYQVCLDMRAVADATGVVIT